MVPSPEEMLEVARRAMDLYERQIRALVEPEHVGEFMVIDVDTGHYEMDRDEIAAMDRARAANPNGRRFLMRVGYPAAYEMGSKWVAGPRL